jgi:dehydrogenase/reductase SDR family member 1
MLVTASIAALVLVAVVWLARKWHRRMHAVSEWDLRGTVVLVTGASRGLGKGIAEALGSCGATVYVTGRSVRAEDAPTLRGTKLSGTVTETAEEITRRGGKGIAVQCDHNDDEQVERLLARVEKEHGRLDVLVNNVFQILGEGQSPPFWRDPAQAIRVFDAYQRVGFRSHFVATALAMRLLMKSDASRRRALVVNISSPGAERYLFNAMYGSNKAGLDRLTRDMAKEVGAHVPRSSPNAAVCVLGLWPGMVATERMLVHRDAFVRKFGVDVAADGESSEFTGRAIAALFTDQQRLQRRNGSIMHVSSVADHYNFADVDGRRPPSMYSLTFLCRSVLPNLLSRYFGNKSNESSR